jgi:ribosomal protein S27AE
MIFTSQRVHCPNCGHMAERHHISSESLVRTQCGQCDYLMITCSKTGKVIEAYAPGVFAGAIR